MIRDASEFGLMADFHGGPPLDPGSEAELIGEFAEFRRQQLESGKFDFVRGNARFIDSKNVEVALLDGTIRRISGATFLIATGSHIHHVEIPDLSKSAASPATRSWMRTHCRSRSQSLVAARSHWSLRLFTRDWV